MHEPWFNPLGSNQNIKFISNSCGIALRWMPKNTINDKSILVQVMAWCRQAASHYLSQCWPRSLSPCGVTWPQRVNANLSEFHFFRFLRCSPFDEYKLWKRQVDNRSGMFNHCCAELISGKNIYAFSNHVTYLKIVAFWYWILFPRVQSTVNQHWFK